MPALGNIDSGSPQAPGVAAQLRTVADLGLDRFLHDLADLVAIDSATSDHEGVDNVGEVLGTMLTALGVEVECRRDGPAGRTLIGRFMGDRPGPRILVAGHLDTVFPRGTAAYRPFRVDGDRALGPGVADMKGGLLLVVHALEALRRVGFSHLPAGEMVFVASPDEESGSPVGSAALREEAARADIGLVLEPARPNGALVVSRKGMVHGSIKFRGRAAHAGIEPEAGRSALLAAAHAVIGLHELTASEPGLTCSVGTLTAGTQANVVPAEAAIEFDLRAPSPEGMLKGRAHLDEICNRLRGNGVSVELTVESRYAPMVASAASEDLLARAVAIGRDLGCWIEAVASGGASDANIIAEASVPVIDGLGPVGGSTHSDDEFIVLSRISERVALLGALLLDLCTSWPSERASDA